MASFLLCVFAFLFAFAYEDADWLIAYALLEVACAIREKRKVE